MVVCPDGNAVSTAGKLCRVILNNLCFISEYVCTTQWATWSPYLDEFEANAGRKCFVEEECFNLIIWISGNPPVVEQVCECSCKFVQTARVDAKEL